MSEPRMMPTAAIVEEMRVMGEAVAATDAATDPTAHWMTPEFWTMVGGAVANLLTVGVLMGWLNQDDAATVTKSVTALLGATQVIVLNSVLVWKYVAGRTTLRAKLIDARYQYMSAVAVEKMRLMGR